MLDAPVLLEVEDRALDVVGEVEGGGDDLVVFAERGAAISPVGAMIAEPPIRPNPSSLPALAAASTQVPF
ncbi:MAG: hypothetical protein WBX30_07300 [Stellaceae bacterium]